MAERLFPSPTTAPGSVYPGIYDDGGPVDPIPERIDIDVVIGPTRIRERVLVAETRVAATPGPTRLAPTPGPTRIAPTPAPTRLTRGA